MEPPELRCDCGHTEDQHLQLFTSNRCTECNCQGFEPWGFDD